MCRAQRAEEQGWKSRSKALAGLQTSKVLMDCSGPQYKVKTCMDSVEMNGRLPHTTVVQHPEWVQSQLVKSKKIKVSVLCRVFYPWFPSSWLSIYLEDFD